VRKQLFIQLFEPASSHLVSSDVSGDAASEPSGGEAAMTAPASWVLRDENRPTGALFHGNLAEAAAQAVGARVSVLVPGADVLLAQVELPVMKSQRLARAVPYALEEQLAEDVDGLHVAIGQQNKTGRVANAVVSRSRLESWLAQLKAAGLQADVMTPEMFGVQWEQGDAAEQSRWSMLVDAQRGLLRTGAQTGLAFDMDNLESVLRACFDDAGDHLPSSLRVTICSDSGFDDGFGSDFKGSDSYRCLTEMCAAKSIDLSLDVRDETRSETLAQRFDEQHAINLLQGDFSRKQQLEKLLRPWRPAIILLGLWLLMQMSMFVAEYSRLSTSNSELKEQIEAVYRDAFPQSHNIVNPKVQMQRGLEKLRSGGGQNEGLLPLLAQAGAVFKDTNGVILRTLRFKSNKLDVDIEIPDLQSLDKLKQRLSDEAKLSVEIVSASSREGKVESRLTLELPPSAGGGK
jgi:general secretion pathway protein L